MPDVCIPNIGRRQRRIRLALGAGAAVAGVALAAAILALDLTRLVRLAVFLPFLGATQGYFQFREHT